MLTDQNAAATTNTTIAPMLAGIQDKVRTVYAHLRQEVALQVRDTNELLQRVEHSPIAAGNLTGMDISHRALKIVAMQAEIQSLTQLYERFGGQAFSLPSED